MSTYNPSMVIQRDTEDFPKIRVTDLASFELLSEVIIQLRLVSMKLDCLQPNDDTIDRNELDTDDFE